MHTIDTSEEQYWHEFTKTVRLTTDTIKDVVISEIMNIFDYLIDYLIDSLKDSAKTM